MSYVCIFLLPGALLFFLLIPYISSKILISFIYVIIVSGGTGIAIKTLSISKH